MKFHNPHTEKFQPGKTPVLYAGPIFGKEEMEAVQEPFKTGWFSGGSKTLEFEEKMSKLLGSKFSVFVNSGSSANLVAISALKMKKGSEVIVPATSFPTTVNPIIQNNLKPVFIDCEVGTYNPTPEMIEGAISKKTKAIFFAHTLGNPLEMKKIMKIVRDNNLILVEDICDAIGAKYDNKFVGTFGVMSTLSMYPAHHITSGGEGGMVFINDSKYHRDAKSIRDWGRGCWCRWNEGKPKGACGKRFEFKGLDGTFYDHRFFYTNIGYNLKATEFQAAFGLVQLKRLPGFWKKREENFDFMYKLFKKYEDYFVLPKSLPRAEPAWFSFPLTLKEKTPFTREEFMEFLGNKKISTRYLFAGNVLNHPAYKNIEKRVVGNLEGSKTVFKNTFFLGVWPGITKEMLDYVKSCVEEFMQKY